MVFSVICCIYNGLPVVMKSLTSLFETCPKDQDCEVILVDNHSPDERSRAYLSMLVNDFALSPAGKPKLHVFDPGRNLGCHQGWNYGYQRSSGKYVCKFDDDTIIQTPGWAPKMAHALEMVPELAYLSADIDAKQNNVYSHRTEHGVRLQVAVTGVVGFSLVMFRRRDIEHWGPMKTGPYHAAGGKAITTDRLYGGEEVYYATAARAEQRLIAHFPDVFCHHMDNAERHPDYPMWKRSYGYYGWTNADMETWIRSGDHLNDYARAIGVELNTAHPNDVLLRDWVTRLGEIGSSVHKEPIRFVLKRTQNDVVREAGNKALDLITEREKVS